MMLLSPNLTLVAQTEGTEEPTQVVATQVQETPAPAPTIPVDSPASDFDFILTITGSISLIIVIGGCLLLALRGLDAAKVSVPQEIVDKIATQVVTVMTTTMQEIGKQVQASPSPIDDAIWAVGRIPVETLIEELSKRTLTPDTSLKAYQAIQRTLDDTATGNVSPFIDE